MSDQDTDMQTLADAGAFRMGRMRAEAKAITEQVTGVIGRKQALAKAAEIAANMDGITVEKFKELAAFCFEFCNPTEGP